MTGGPSPAGAGGRSGLRVALQRGEEALAAAGVPSPRTDVELLAASVLGTSRGSLAAAVVRGDVVEPAALDRLAELVAERARRVPLQHLTGRAGFRGLDLAVGPGVFVPRPETEDLAGAAVEAARAASGAAPVVVDLCAGSGAIALAVADEVPQARVHAVELDPAAHAWARRNVDDLAARHGPRPGGAVDLRLGDAATAFEDLLGTVDVVVSNPPYVPPDAVPTDPEVRDHDPELALYGGGDDGLRVPRALLVRAAHLLRPGGVVLMEHSWVQQPALLAALAGPAWTAPSGHRDLAGRPRWVRAVRSAGPTPASQVTPTRPAGEETASRSCDDAAP